MVESAKYMELSQKIAPQTILFVRAWCELMQNYSQVSFKLCFVGKILHLAGIKKYHTEHCVFIRKLFI